MCGLRLICFVSMHVRVCSHVCRCLEKAEGGSEPSRAELEAAVNCLMFMLGTKLLVRTSNTLHS